MRSKTISLINVSLLLSNVNAFLQGNKRSRPNVVVGVTKEKFVVAVTREDGKNDKLIQEISNHQELSGLVEVCELPCIEHASGPDYESLGTTLVSEKWDYVAVTSPEAAKVVASAWDAVRDNPIPVAAVGKATENVLRTHDIPVTFVPSKATAKVLAAELELRGEGTTLLYPASARAKKTLQEGLAARGFDVTRLNTYDTVTATWTEEQKAIAQKVQIACFASPSSIKGWLANTDQNNKVLAACIGETSAEACRGHGWDESQISYPDSPGIEGWVEAIEQSVQKLNAPSS